jgi:hypothetical protein
MAGTRWEYRIVNDRSELAKLGLDGWELVQVAVCGERETFYLKCPSIREEITASQRANVLGDQPGRA